MNATKRNYLTGAVLMLGMLSCNRQNQLEPANGNLTGNWSGNYETQQLGSCTWTGVPVTATATFQVVGTVVTATVNQIAGSTSVPAQLTGTLSGNMVSLSRSNNAICNGISRVYVNRFDGVINNNTLTLVSRDTICPAQGCVFQRTLRLTRQ